MNSIANQAELILETAGTSRGWVCVNKGSAQNHQASSEFGSGNRLFHRKTAHSLHRHLYRSNHFSQLIERAWIWPSHRREAAAFVVPDMMNDEVAAQILQPLRGR